MTLPTNKYIKTVFLFFLLMAYPVSGIHYSITCIAQTQSEDEIEFKKCLTKAQAGDVNAQFFLGCRYESGHGVPKNYRKAVEWYAKAAEQGDVRGQYYLGLCYYKGNGVLKDYTKAVELFAKPAGRKVPRYPSMLAMLGTCYVNGHGVRSNIDKAIKWYTKAADDGNEYAMKCLKHGNWGASKIKKSFTFQDYEFEVVNSNEVELTLWIGDHTIPNIMIPSSVTDNEGKQYRVVGISDWAFNGEPIQNVILPEGLRYIDIGAFYNCKLQEIDIPSSIEAIGDDAFYGNQELRTIILHNQKDIRWGVGCFKNCENIDMVKGMPKAINNILEELDKNCLFAKNFPEFKKTFTYFAYGEIMERMREWQKKKEYETVAQWEERVTEQTRQQKLNALIEDMKYRYISEKSPSPFYLKGSLGEYDTDYEVFPITIRQVSNICYVKVPVKYASHFKQNWENVAMFPTYGIVNDQLAVLSCTFRLKNKVYESVRNIENDNVADMALNLSPLKIDFDVDDNRHVIKQDVVKVDNSIDFQIPSNKENNDNTFAVIIGNENYRMVPHVEYAQNDAKIFAAYCQKTLGLPARNIRSYSDATYGTMLAALKDIKDIADAYNGNIDVIFYYAGHGIPDGKGNAYLLPVDADGTQTEVCMPTSRLYQKLNELNAMKLVVFMDACFSGAQRGDGMLMAVRGVAIKSVSDIPAGNCVVFCASNGEETAFPFKEKGHGMFTYFLLKKLQETKGDVTLGDLASYIVEQVCQQSVIINRKLQTPTVIPSRSISESWKNMQLK